MKRYVIGIGLAILILSLGGCDKSTDSPFSETGNISLSDGEGNPSTGLEGGESAFWGFGQLLPTTVYDFTLKNQSDIEVAKATLTTDANGEIPLTAIGYDLGLDFPGGSNGRSLSKVLDVETFTIEVYNIDGKLVTTQQFTVDYGAPVVFAADQDGYAQNSFLRNQHPVWAKGKNLTSGAVLDIYVVDDIRYWELGTPLTDVSGAPEIVTVNGNGEFHTRVWPNPSLVAPYDIVADFDRDGYYSAGDLVDGYYPVGFMVQTYATAGEDIQVQIACNNNYEYVDIFQTTDNVYAYLNPRIQQFTHKWVHKYVVIHQAVWNDGDPLDDVTQVPELDTPQYGCTNEGRVLIWPATLTAGKYDVVIDVDRNGFYDKGLDFLDNIDSYGQSTAGFIVGAGVAGPTVTITSPENGVETTDEIVYLAGDVSDTAILFAKLIVNGSSQTIGVNSGVLDNTAIVLQRGWNTIRVEAFNTDGGIGFDEITINGNFPTYGMKVTLTWNLGPSSDVDLWVQDPTGEWCGYTNKETDIGGWLDVDDTYGYGPENFRLSHEAVAANPGAYNVVVHYYSFAGDPTIPTLQIVLNEGQTNQITRTLVGPSLNFRETWNATTITMPGGTFSDYAPAGKLLINSDRPLKTK
ncbi:hypothetical protein KKF86_00140 [bacterium]|nr:hypothetical protein [bacterium]